MNLCMLLISYMSHLMSASYGICLHALYLDAMQMLYACSMHPQCLTMDFLRCRSRVWAFATSASTLLSLITYPYLDTAGRTDTIRGLTALAQACSHLSSMSFTGSLLAACGELLLSSVKTSEPCSPIKMLYSSSVHRVLLGCFFKNVQGLHPAAHTSLVQL